MINDIVRSYQWCFHPLIQETLPGIKIKRSLIKGRLEDTEMKSHKRQT